MILSGVEPNEASEASGLQGTAQNLGMALGTAVIGTVILSVALSSISTDIQEAAAIPDELEQQIDATLESGLVEPGKTELREALGAQPPDVQAEAQRIFDEGTLRGFQGAIIVGGLVALFGALMAFRLPLRKLEGDPGRPEAGGAKVAVAETVRNTTIPGIHLEMDDLPAAPPT
jgi:hypothetical protein